MLVLQALLSTKYLLIFPCESFQELMPSSFVCGKYLRVESLGWCMLVFEREEPLKITSLSCPQLSRDSTVANINSPTAQVQRDSLPRLPSSLLYQAHLLSTHQRACFSPICSLLNQMCSPLAHTLAATWANNTILLTHCTP